MPEMGPSTIISFGTCDGHILRFSQSSFINGSLEDIRLLASLVNLNSINSVNTRIAGHEWIEMQLNERHFIIYPLYFGDLKAFIAKESRRDEFDETSIDCNRLLLIHIRTAIHELLGSVAPKVLQILHDFSIQQADAGSFNSSISESAPDLVDVLSASCSAEDCEKILNTWQSFEECFLDQIATQGSKLYEHIFAPLLGNFASLAAAEDMREAKARGFLFQYEGGKPTSTYGLSLVHSLRSKDVPTEETVAAMSVFVECAEQKFKKKHLDSTHTSTHTKIAFDRREVLSTAKSIHALSVWAPEHCLNGLALAIIVPADTCPKDCQHVDHLPAWLQQAWSETIRRIDEVFSFTKVPQIFKFGHASHHGGAQPEASPASNSLLVSQGLEGPSTPQASVDVHEIRPGALTPAPPSAARTNASFSRSRR